MKKLTRGMMLKHPMTGELWKYDGGSGVGDKFRFFMIRYKPSFIQDPMTLDEIINKNFEFTDEVYSWAIHNPPYLPEAVSELKDKDNGWLSPDGVFYSCKNRGHRSLAKAICFHFLNMKDNRNEHDLFDDELEKRGWFKLWTMDYPNGKASYWASKDEIERCTSAQEEIIRQHSLINNFELPYFLD